MDTTDDLWNDLAQIVSHIYVRPEDAAKRWTTVDCKDYQLPLSAIINFLEHAVPPLCDEYREIKNDWGYQAIRDIISNSHLNELLEFDDSQRRFRYQTRVAASIKTEIANFIAKRSPPPLITIRPASERAKND